MGGENEVKNFDYQENNFGIRHLQCFLISVCLGVTYALEVNMPIAIVAMTDTSVNSTFGVYEWPEKTKSLVLSSCFMGSVIGIIPADLLARKFGGKAMIFSSLFLSSVLAVLTPICASFGSWTLIFVVRFIQGVCLGTTFPAMHNFLSKWAPVQERAKLETFCYCGSQLGTALMLSVSGEIITSTIGWPGVFYISGAIGCLWAALWDFFSSSCPEDSHFITEEEKMYIEMLPIPSCENGDGDGDEEYEEYQPPLPPIPWKDIFKSMPFISLMIANCSTAWVFCTLLTQIPGFLRNVLQLDIQKTALFSALPFWVMLAMSLFFMFISEMLNRNQLISVSTSRKLFNTISHWVPMIGLIALTFYNGKNDTFVIVLLTLSVGMISANYFGFQMNHFDLSPNFAGTLMGLSNCAAFVTSAIAILAVGFIVSDEKNPQEWNIVFYVAAGFFFVGNLIFIIFGKFEKQSWNETTTLMDANGEPVTPRHSINPNMESVY
ncbi:putative inorganic phosphate cotransporter [Episyrphus balteatus]|uniref:putative inorganic phosphate cotransporter n=1 Tax=Episyrphus balteatus TaxID=286459 RepID=UPI002485CEFF|nr:putative inorganic phosphate cotransporter [Episyrphus balteatus]